MASKQKNIANFGFEHQQNLHGFVWPDIKDEGPKTQRTVGDDINSAIKTSSSSGGLFAWKQVGRKPQKLQVKVEGNPNKFKNHSVIRIKTNEKEIKRYDTTVSSTFTQKQIEMVNRRANFDTSKPHPLHHSNLQSDLKKALITSWKRPKNWLNSFKPGVERLRRSESQKILTPRIDKYFTSIDMKANRLEMRSPFFRSSMKESFIPRQKYFEADKTHQRYRKIFGKAKFSLGNYKIFGTKNLQDDLIDGIPNLKRSIFDKLEEDKIERDNENKRNKKIVEIDDNKVTHFPPNVDIERVLY